MSTETWDTLKGWYETFNTSQFLLIKTKFLSIKMEEKEDASTFLSRIKELKDNLVDVSEKVSNIDLVTITLNGMLEE